MDKRVRGGRLYLKKGTVVDVKAPTGALPWEGGGGSEMWRSGGTGERGARYGAVLC